MEENKEIANNSALELNPYDKIGQNYIENMPKLSECAKMSDNKLFKNLSGISISDFYGLHPKKIQASITLNEAVRYLTDLVIINDMNKSKFFMVSEKSCES